MKKPEPVPDVSKNLQEIVAIFDNPTVLAQLSEIEKEYLYWEKFKYKVKELPFLAEILWKFTKIQRNRAAEKLKISDINGFTFQYNTPVHILRLLHEFDLNIGGVLESSSIIPAENKQRYLISSIMEEAIASSQIEGAVTTREEAKAMLRQNRPPRNNSDKMIMNNYRTMQQILEVRDKTLSRELILNIHASITKGTLENGNQEGEFRKSDTINVIDAITGEVFYCPPKAEDIEELMQAVCQFVNTTEKNTFIHPIIKGIILHFLIGYIHPFHDGNGRTARAVFYWYLISKGYWLVEYLSISRIILKSNTQYAKAYLYTEYDENDLTYFIDYNLKSMDLAMRSLKEYIGKKIKEKSLLFDIIKKESINERQVEILQDIANDPERIITIMEVQEYFGVAYQTARTDLLGLVDLGYLSSKTMGKKMIFFKADNFENKKNNIKSS